MKSQPGPTANGGFFVTIASPDGSTTKRVDGDSMLVGRADDCQLTVSHETLSRRHLTILLKNGVCFVEDHASSNGTFINGRRIAAHTPTRIVPDDQITMGQANVKLSVSTEPLARKNEPMRPSAKPVIVSPAATPAPPEIVVENTRTGANVIIGRDTYADIKSDVPEILTPKVRQRDEANEVIERSLQDAKKKAAATLQQAELEAEKRVEEIYRRAHETQAKMDEVYQKRTNEAYRASEQIYQKAQEESQRILEVARLRSTEIRKQAESFVMDLRRRTEDDCERMLSEAQTTARDLKEQRLLEAEDMIKIREMELIKEARTVLEDRVARFERDMVGQAQAQHDQLDAEEKQRREQLDLELKAQVEQVRELNQETVQLRELRAREQTLLSDIEFEVKKRRDESNNLKEDLDFSKKAITEFNRELIELRAGIKAAALEKAEAEAKVKEAQSFLSKVNEDTRQLQMRVSEARERGDQELVLVRAQLEESKIRLQQQEVIHLEELRHQTTNQIAALEHEMFEELERKRDVMTREISLEIETLLKESGSPSSAKLQNVVGARLREQISHMSRGDKATAKQTSLVSLKRRQRFASIGLGLIAGAGLILGGERALVEMNNDQSPLQRFVASAAKEHAQELEARKFSPPLSPDFKSTYVDNVVYTENFVATYTSDDFQKKFAKAVTPYMLKTWKVEEDTVFELLGISVALVKTLGEKRAAIHPDFVQKGLDKMKESETEVSARMRKLLGSSVRVESFRKFEQTFYEKYKPVVANDEINDPPPRTPSVESN